MFSVESHKFDANRVISCNRNHWIVFCLEGGNMSPLGLRPHSHCQPSRADLNWKWCSGHFWNARMSNQVHLFSLMDNIWWRSLLFTKKRRVWVHNISSRRERLSEFYNLLDDLLNNPCSCTQSCYKIPWIIMACCNMQSAVVNAQWIWIKINLCCCRLDKCHLFRLGLLFISFQLNARQTLSYMFQHKQDIFRKKSSKKKKKDVNVRIHHHQIRATYKYMILQEYSSIFTYFWCL